MSDTRKRAAVYARQSHGKMTSVEDQTREAHAVCDTNGWTATVYCDKVSASRFGTRERDDWSQLILDVTAGKLDVVILWDSSRGDRTPTTWTWFLERCRKHGVLIHVIRDKHTYDLSVPRDWKTLHDSGTDAAYESEIKSVDIRRGVAGAALAGKPHGSAAYGYRRVYDETDRKIFTQVPDAHAPIAREIIERVARRDPIVHIVADLKRRGIPSPTGGPAWHRNTIRGLVRRPVYAGLRHHNGVDHEGNWGGLVPVETWRAAVAVLADPTRKMTRPGRYRWLLSYLVVAPCGAPLQGTAGRQGRRDTYHCSVCGCVGVGVWELDGYITGLVLERLSREDARAVFAVDDAQSAVARAAVLAVRLELDDLAEQLAAGKLSATLAAAAEPTIRRRLAEAEADLARHTRHGALLALLDADDIRAAWDELSTAGRRSVIDVLFEKITVGPAGERLSRWSKDEDRLRLAMERTTIEWA